MLVMAESALRSPTVRASQGGPVLSVRGLEAWYGESHILQGMNFDLYPGEVITLLGRNGAGKTTTLRAIMGMIAKRRGSVVCEGTETIACPRDTSHGSALATVPRSGASSRACRSKKT